MRDKFATVTNVAMLVSAVVLMGYAIAQYRSVDDHYVVTTPLTESDWKGLLGEGNVVGPPEAGVQIVEFADYQCPACKDLHSKILKVREKYPQDLQIIYRHFPLRNIHPYATQAALAAECAADQDEFANYHHLLYSRQGEFSTTIWTAIAKEAGVADISEFQTCLDEVRFQVRLAEDIAAGRKLGVTLTPTYFVNGKLYASSPSFDHLLEIVEAAIES